MRSLFVIIILTFITKIAFPQLMVNGTLSNEELARKIIGQGVIVSNILVNCPGSAIGEYTSTGLPINEGLILSTGDINNAVGPNSNVSMSHNYGQAGDFQLDVLAGSPTYDACSIEFDFIPQCDNLNINFFFASEEYDEYIGREYNDVFGMYITGEDPNNLTTPYNNLNLALVPNTTTPITVNSINSGINSNLYTNNDAGNEIEFDGYTSSLNATIELTPCETYHLKIAIADVTDGIFDSGIFIESNSFLCNNVIYDLQTNAENVKENCSPGKITFCRDTDLANPKTFNITTSGTALNGVDYIIPNSITIPANQQCYELNIPYITDNIIEPTETIEIIYQNGVCPILDTITITIEDAFVIDAGNNTTTCMSDSITIGNINNAIYDLSWSNPTDLNDNTLSTPILIPNAVTSNIQTQKYYKVIATRNDGCIAIDSLEVLFNPSPIIDYQIIDQCQDALFTINNLSNLNDINGSYSWDFDNGSISFLDSPTLSYNNYGNYDIQLIANNTFGCSDTLIKPIVIHPLPEISFIKTDTCMGKSTCFNNTSSIQQGGMSSWVWNFGDNSNYVNLENPCHIFDSSGIFTVELIGSSNEGCVSTFNTNITIYPNPILSYSIDNHCLNTPYLFNNYSTVPYGNIDSFDWFFGDNSTSTLTSPTYSYSSPGNYNTTLKAISNFGCIDSLIKILEVYELPIADFNSNINETCQQSCIEFNFIQNNNNSNILEYNWQFSNGYLGQGENFEQCFEASGMFDVTLIIEDENECLDTITKPNFIEIFPSPISNFSTNTSHTNMYDPFIEIENYTIYDCNNWYYSFGNGNSNTSNQYEPSFTYQYLDAGEYIITQVVSNDFGCIDSSSIPIRIDPVKTLFIPNSFTPNNDGNNDTFYPRGINVNPFKLEIFNHWGTIIFTSNNIENSWDGTHKGKECLSDVYIYKITYGSEDNTRVKTGTVTLIR